jgi:hypothetical protein
VHRSRGAVISTLVLEGASSYMEDSPGAFHDPNCDIPFRELARVIAAAAGRDAQEISAFEMLLYEKGQAQQDLHQDGPVPMLAFLVALTDGAPGTQFVKYEGRNPTRMSHEQLREHNVKVWSNLPPRLRTDPGLYASAGIMAAGDIVAFNTGHIHRAPPPPRDDSVRRVIFCSFDCDAPFAQSRPVRSAEDALSAVMPHTTGKKLLRGNSANAGNGK